MWTAATAAWSQVVKQRKPRLNFCLHWVFVQMKGIICHSCLILPPPAAPLAPFTQPQISERNVHNGKANGPCPRKGAVQAANTPKHQPQRQQTISSQNRPKRFCDGDAHESECRRHTKCTWHTWSPHACIELRMTGRGHARYVEVPYILCNVVTVTLVI